MWEFLSSVISTGCTLLIIILLLLYYQGTKDYGFWKKLGIPYIEPKYPYLGTFYKFQLGYKTLAKSSQEIYEKYRGQRFVGTFLFTEPRLYLIDVKLIETILVKDFTSFYNRRKHLTKGFGRISCHLPNLLNLQWKSLRQKLSPTFTPNKLKNMIEQFLFSLDNIIKNLQENVNKNEPIEIELLFKRFVSDIIGLCAFGVNPNTLEDPNSDYSKFCENIHKPSTYKLNLRLFRDVYPNLKKLFRKNHYDNRLEEFFISMIKKNKEYREKNNIVRNDFFQSLLELRKQDAELMKSDSTKDHLIFDDELLYSNAFIFYTAGFETLASSLSYCIFDIAVHEEIQEQLHQHVISVLKEHDGKISYESINGMSFLNQVVNESLRLRPPIPEFTRVVTKEYQIPGTDIILPKGLVITIPAQSIQMDPKYFPEPHKFLPERFDPENKTVRKETFMTFGDGPRMCIGKQFSLLVIKIAVSKLIMKYKFKINHKTKIPLQLATATYFSVPAEGIWLDVEKRI